MLSETTCFYLQYNLSVIFVACSQTELSSSEKLFGDKVWARSPKVQKFLIEVPYVCQVKVHVFSFNMILLSYVQSVPRPSYPFRRNFGRSGKGRSPKNLELLIEVPKVVHVKVHVLSFNMILISSQQSFLTSSYPFQRKFG